MTEIPSITELGWWTIFFGGVSTIAVYSYLYKENPLYRLFEHFYIGIATGLMVIVSLKTFLWPVVLEPLLGLDRVPFPDGSYAEPYNKNYLWFLLPMAFGSLYYCILSKRLNWLAQLVIGFQLGYAGGNAFKGVLTEIMPQITDSFRPLYIPEGMGGDQTTLSNLVFVFTLLTVLSYFFFTFKRSEGGIVERSASAGRWMMMGCFGAFFGSTIMARMALLVERLDFLINDWWLIFW